MKMHDHTLANTRRFFDVAIMVGVWAFTFLPATDVGAQGWSLTLGAGETYDSNVNLSGPTDSGNLATNVEAGVGRTLAFRGGGFNFAANASQIFYQDYTPLNHLNYNVVGSASLAVTRRLSWSVTDSLNSSYSRDNKLLTDAGVFIPTVVTRSNAASTQLAYALSPRTQVHWSIAEQSVVFGSREFAGGANLTTTEGLARQMSRSQTLGVTHSYQRTFSSGQQGAIQSVLGTWSSTLGKSLTVNASGGVQPYTQPGQKTYQFSPAVNVGLAARLSQNQSASLSYARAIEQAFGLTTGTHLAQTVSAALTRSLGRQLSVVGSGSYSRGSYALLPGVATVGYVADVSIHYSATRSLSIVIDTSAYAYTFDPNPAVRSYRSMVSLAYGKTWR